MAHCTLKSGACSWLDFVLNWVTFVDSVAQVSNYFVASLDVELFQELQGRGIPCVLLISHLTGTELAWGSEAFKERVPC